MTRKGLFRLDPDDPPAVFCRKLHLLSERDLPAEIEKFRAYAKYLPVLKFHRAALRRPEMNVRLAYNEKHGFHASSCLRSLPQEMPDGEPCTCDRDFEDPHRYFHRIEADFKLHTYWRRVLRNGRRCALCKHFDVDWQWIDGAPRRSGPSAHLIKS